MKVLLYIIVLLLQALFAYGSRNTSANRVHFVALKELCLTLCVPTWQYFGPLALHCLCKRNHNPLSFLHLFICWQYILIEQVSPTLNEEEIQTGLNSVCDWCKIVPSVVSTNMYVVWSFPYFSSSYFISNQALRTASSHRDLGIVGSKNLSLCNHYSHVCRSAFFEFNHHNYSCSLSNITFYISLLGKDRDYILFRILEALPLERYRAYWELKKSTKLIPQDYILFWQWI